MSESTIRPVVEIPERTSRRVLLVNRVAHLGGVERVVLTLADGLQRLGWEPVLASPGDGALPAAAKAQGLTVAPCDFDRMRITADPRVFVRYPSAFYRGSLAIEQACRKNRVDVIHAHHPVTALYSFRAARSFRIPIVLHVHETLPAKPLYALAISRAVRHASIVICVSKAAEELALSMGADPARTRIVSNGVDSRFLSPQSMEVPQTMRDVGPGPHVGVFGVLEPRKGQHLLLDAAAMLAPRFPTAHFWLIGPAALKDKQGYVDRLRRKAIGQCLNGRVTFADFQVDVIAWMQAMTVVVQPSTALESFGMSVAEALTLGRPVVASRIGGLPEVVRDGQTGLIVPPGDSAALADAIGALLASPDRCAALGQQGALNARSRFTPEVFQRAMVDAYSAAIQSTQAA